MVTFISPVSSAMISPWQTAYSLNNRLQKEYKRGPIYQTIVPILLCHIGLRIVCAYGCLKDSPLLAYRSLSSLAGGVHHISKHKLTQETWRNPQFKQTCLTAYLCMLRICLIPVALFNPFWVLDLKSQGYFQPQEKLKNDQTAGDTVKSLAELAGQSLLKTLRESHPEKYATKLPSILATAIHTKNYALEQEALFVFEKLSKKQFDQAIFINLLKTAVACKADTLFGYLTIFNEQYAPLGMQAYYEDHQLHINLTYQDTEQCKRAFAFQHELNCSEQPLIQALHIGPASSCLDAEILQQLPLGLQCLDLSSLTIKDSDIDAIPHSIKSSINKICLGDVAEFPSLWQSLATFPCLKCLQVGERQDPAYWQGLPSLPIEVLRLKKQRHQPIDPALFKTLKLCCPQLKSLVCQKAIEDSIEDWNMPPNPINDKQAFFLLSESEKDVAEKEIKRKENAIYLHTDPMGSWDETYIDKPEKGLCLVALEAQKDLSINRPFDIFAEELALADPHAPFFDRWLIQSFDDDVQESFNPKNPLRRRRRFIDIHPLQHTIKHHLDDLYMLDLSFCRFNYKGRYINTQGAYSTLEHLNLSYSNLSNDQIIDMIKRCPQLKSLDLEDNSCELDDTLLMSIATHCPHLRSINLMTCRYSKLTADDSYGLSLKGLEALFKACPKLTSIKMEMDSDILDPGQFFKLLGTYCSKLISLSLKFSKKYYGYPPTLTDKELKTFVQGCPHLQILHLNECQIQDEGLIEIANGCPNLLWLDLGECFGITDQSAKIVAQKCPRLRRLDLHRSYCYSSDITDITLQALGKHCHGLTCLILTTNRNITAKGITALMQGCPFLDTLDLGFGDHNFEEAFVTPNRLKRLSLIDTKHTVEGLQKMAQACKQLTWLGLGKNSFFADEMLASISAFKHLKSLCYYLNSYESKRKNDHKRIREFLQNHPNLEMAWLQIAHDRLEDSQDILSSSKIKKLHLTYY